MASWLCHLLAVPPPSGLSSPVCDLTDNTRRAVCQLGAWHAVNTRERKAPPCALRPLEASPQHLTLVRAVVFTALCACVPSWTITFLKTRAFPISDPFTAGNAENLLPSKKEDGAPCSPEIPTEHTPLTACTSVHRFFF